MALFNRIKTPLSNDCRIDVGTQKSVVVTARTVATKFTIGEFAVLREGLTF